MFVNFGKEEEKHCLKLVKEIREAGISTELYPDAAKMKKQMKYANQKSIPGVVLIGEEEMKSELYTYKNMDTGEQQKVNLNQLISILKA
jgi:histidyl-tRNA synthetase